MKILSVLVVLGVCGCAGTYKAPMPVDVDYSRAYVGVQQDVFNAAKRQLALMGYTIQLADESAGIVSTAPKSISLTPADADCGSTMGLDYLRDKRTNTTVALNVIVDSGEVTVKSNIFGEYRPGDVTQNITLSCVSRGVIEQAILASII